MRRKRFLSLAVLLVCSPLRGQTSAVSAPIRDVRYEVAADTLTVGRRELEVSMTFQVDGTAPVVLALPAWSPGHYVLEWFAQRVAGFAAESGGTPLEWSKIDYQTWSVRPRSPGRVRVSFRYHADAVDRAVAWTAPDFAFFNGTNLFMYPVGRGFDWPAEVIVRTSPDWRVATGLEQSKHGDGFRASNYHDLVDMPFYVGRFAIDSTRIADRWFRLAMYPASSMTAARRERIFDGLEKFVPPEVAVFGEAPFRNYTIFLRSDTVVNVGGLEHQSSQVDEQPPQALDGDLSGLFAHELFHSWNVKRLRPADLVPYRYGDAQPTRWLWVSEGVTDYYGALARVRGGINDGAAFRGYLANVIASVAAAPPTALGDVSLSAWIGARDGSEGLYYPKGALAGFLLDVMIRDASDNRRSLDDVMHTLYETTYKRGKGFTSDEWWAAVRRAAGARSFADFARRYVDGREPLPIDSVLALAALRMEHDTLREPRLGVLTAFGPAGVRITQVNAGGAGDAAGVRSGDRVVALGDVAVVDNSSFDAFRAKYSGTSATALPIVVERGGDTLTLQVPVRLFTRVVTRVVSNDAAPEKARRILSGILGGAKRGS